MCNFHYLGYYCSPNLSIHQNSTQEPTWNFLVTLDYTQLFDPRPVRIEIDRHVYFVIVTIIRHYKAEFVDLNGLLYYLKVHEIK